VRNSLKHKLVLTTALVASVCGYSRRSYADCVSSGGSSFLCSGTGVGAQTITHNEASVSTAAGFSANGGASDGITITGDGALSFTDTNASSITTSGGAGFSALQITSNGNDGGTAGSITVSGDSNFTGIHGIRANNNGTGGISITENGNIVSEGLSAILVSNNSSSSTGAVTVIDNGNITGTGGYGINSQNNGTGLMSITANGDITGVRYGIYGYTTSGSMTITTGPSGNITASFRGIEAYNAGTGATSITVNGDVTGTTQGIYAINHASATGLSITTGPGSLVSSSTTGIKINDVGSGALTISNGTGATIYGGVTGILVTGDGGVAGSITNAGTIHGGGGTAISLNSLAAPLTITLDGGHIIGNVTDNTPANGFSSVNVAENFTSQGNFNISNFNVSSGATFTFGAGNTITSVNPVTDSGMMAVTAAGSSIIGNLHVQSGGILNAGDNFSVTGALTNNGAIDIATGKTLTVATMSAGTGTLNFGLTSAANHAQLTVTGGGANLTGQTLSINLANVNSITNNEQILLIHGANAITGGPGAVATTITDNSALWNFKIVDGTAVSAPTSNSDLFVIASMAPAIPNPNNAAVSQVLTALEGTSDPQLSQVITNMNSAGTSQAVNNVLASVQPSVTAGASVATQNFSNNSLNLADQRLSSLRSADETGISTGDVVYLQGLKAWTQLSGQIASQSERDGVAGYHVHDWGSTFGLDSQNILDKGTVGVAFSYGQANVSASDINATHTDIHSYQLALYSDYDLSDGFYVNGLAGYTFATNNALRYNVGGVSGLTADGDFNSNQLAADAELGRNIHIGNATITPMTMADWAYYKADNYTESGAGGAGLKVSSPSIDYFDVGVGGKASWDITSLSNNSHLIPEIHTSYRRDLIGDSVEATSSFIGGGTVFSTQGARPAQNKFNVGGQIKYYDTDNIELTANYDFDIKEGYTSRMAYVRAAYKF